MNYSCFHRFLLWDYHGKGGVISFYWIWGYPSSPDPSLLLGRLSTTTYGLTGCILQTLCQHSRHRTLLSSFVGERSIFPPALSSSGHPPWIRTGGLLTKDITLLFCNPHLVAVAVGCCHHDVRTKLSFTGTSMKLSTPFNDHHQRGFPGRLLFVRVV